MIPSPTYPTSISRERTIPANIEAERATLGSVLLNREAIIAVASWLSSDDFYVEQHAWIYDAMLQCYNTRVPPDVRTVSDELRRRDRLDAVGGVPRWLRWWTACQPRITLNTTRGSCSARHCCGS